MTLIFSAIFSLILTLSFAYAESTILPTLEGLPNEILEQVIAQCDDPTQANMACVNQKLNVQVEYYRRKDSVSQSAIQDLHQLLNQNFENISQRWATRSVNLTTINSFITPDRAKRILTLLHTYQKDAPITDTFGLQLTRLIDWTTPSEPEAQETAVTESYGLNLIEFFGWSSLNEPNAIGPGPFKSFLDWMRSHSILSVDDKYLQLDYTSRKTIQNWSNFPFIDPNFALRLLDAEKQNLPYQPGTPDILQDLAGLRLVRKLDGGFQPHSKTHPFYWKLYETLKLNRQPGAFALNHLLKNPFVGLDLLEAAVHDAFDESANIKYGFQDSLFYSVLESVLLNPNLSPELFQKIYSITTDPNWNLNHVLTAVWDYQRSFLFLQALASNPHIYPDQQTQLFEIIESSTQDQQNVRFNGYEGLIKNSKTPAQIISEIKNRIETFPTYRRRQIQNLLVAYRPIVQEEWKQILSSTELLTSAAKNSVTGFTKKQWDELLNSILNLNRSSKRLTGLIHLTLNSSSPRPFRKVIYSESKNFQNPFHRYLLLMALIISH